MAVVHHTTLKPTKAELLTSWLPGRPWYRGTGTPEPVAVGGFRLDDPAGEVGIEFIVLTDGSGPDPEVYLVPLTYRGAPLDGAEHALVGTLEHGVLGRRWVYDGCHDPVLVAQLLALVEGRAAAQDRNTTATPDRDVTRSYSGNGTLAEAAAVAVTDDQEGTVLTLGREAALRLHRNPPPVPGDPASLPEGAIGEVSGSWALPDGVRARGLFAVLYRGSTA
ncbi:1,4-alpha-glucan branching protein [Streptomyces sp. NPDC058953]|uniref:maltokinase N-terminal cap-like domain-containing protein n=1 Tax=unclassified Streptomyces TaxID=2593676 RepID=UPI0036A4D1F4